MIKFLQLRVELRMFLLQGLWSFEECFRDHGKEFGRISRAILIDQRLLSAIRRLAQGLVFLQKNPRPRAVVRALLQERRSIEGPVLLVKLMRELMERDVVTILEIARVPAHIVPGKNDRSPEPRLAEPALVAFVHHARPIDKLRRRQVRARVNQNGMEPGIIIMLPIEQKNAGLRRDRHPDLVGHLQATAALKRLLRQENPNKPPQFRLFVVGEQTVVRHPLTQNAEPGRRKRQLAQSLPSPFSQCPKHAATEGVRRTKSMSQ